MEVPSSSTRDFSHSLYAPSAIDETQSAYAELLPASIAHGPTSSVVNFTMTDEDSQMLVDAFCNHVLFLTIENFRGQNAS